VATRKKAASVKPTEATTEAEQAAEIADWLSQRAGTPIRAERVAPGDEHVLPEREQRELDALPSRLAPA
jgi:hypothetical protein